MIRLDVEIFPFLIRIDSNSDWLDINTIPLVFGEPTQQIITLIGHIWNHAIPGQNGSLHFPDLIDIPLQWVDCNTVEELAAVYFVYLE